MRRSLLSAVLATALVAGVATVSGRAAANGVEAEAETAAFREILEGTNGHQESWRSVPELIILTSVMQFAENGLTAGYAATDERLTEEELSKLAADITTAVGALSGGMISGFAATRLEDVLPGQSIKVFRRGQIVVGRFRDVQKQTGTLGYGGRTARAGVITSAAVMLDRDFDVKSDQRRLLRTHELGHALGYNHVESRSSIMNPRVGSEITDFDRRVIRAAFPTPVGVKAAAVAGGLSRLAQN